MEKDKRYISNFFEVLNTHLRHIRDIHHDDKLLRACFVNVWPRDYDANALASYAFNLPTIAFKAENEKFRNKLIENSEIFSEDINLDPIFIYAHVGHGKTTYIRYLTKIRLKEDEIISKFSNKVFFIYLEYTLSDPDCLIIEHGFFTELDKCIDAIFTKNDIKLDYDTLKEIFPLETKNYEQLKVDTRKSTDDLLQYILKKFDDKKVIIYYRCIIKWLLDKFMIKICCTLDNVDRHLSEFDSENRVIRLFQIISSCFIQIILPLRISNSGFQYNEHFNAIQPIPITLGLPDYGALMTRRIAYIQEYFTEHLNNPIWPEEQSYTTTKDVFDSLNSICCLIKKNPRISNSMALLSNYITREYLDIMTNLFSAKPLFKHPLTGQLIDYTERLSKGKFYSLFIYALMLRNNKELKEDDRNIPIINLFESYISSQWPSLTRWYVLNFLNKKTKKINVFDLKNNITDEYAIPSLYLEKAIFFLAQRKCISIETKRKIEPKNISEALADNDTALLISARGVFHLELSKELEYYEVLAIPELLRSSQNQSIKNTYMSQRKDNLHKYILSIKEAEDNLIRDDNKKEWYMSCWDSLIQEFEQTFTQSQIKN